MNLSRNLSDLYRQVILDHTQHPRHFYKMDDALAVALRNPTCGDEVTLYVRLQDGVVQEASFQGSGCSISMASASILTDAIIGLPAADILRLNSEFRLLVQGHDADTEALGDLEVLSGVAQFPARIKCATLAWNALEQALSQESGGTS